MNIRKLNPIFVKSMEKFEIEINRIEMDRKAKGDGSVKKKYIEQGEMTIWNELYPKYEKLMNDNVNKGLKWISEYISKHSPELSCRGPSKHIMFSLKDEEEFLKCFNFEQKEIKAAIDKSEFIKPNWEVANKPLNMAIELLVFYFYKNMKSMGYNDKNKERSPCYIFTLFMTIRFYSALQKRQFKYEPDEEIMNRTIETMNNRFLLKNMNNIFELLLYLSQTNIENMPETLEKPLDYNLWYFMTNLFNRLSMIIKKIAEEYYKNHAEGYGSTNEDINKTNDEGKKYVDIPTNISTEIAQISRKIRLKMSSDSEVDKDCLEIACKQTKYSKAKMEMCINKIRYEDDVMLMDLIVSILSYYMGSLKNSKQSIKSAKFLATMKKAYGVSNSSDQYILDMKELLSEILKKYSEDFKKTTRVSQLSLIRTTLFYYIILYINKYSE